LEVTNCFPFPSRGEENEAEDQALVEYQIEMMRGLREVNVDNNTVGWYTSTFCSFLSPSLINDQFKYQKTINKCVVVVYDPLKSSQGTLSFQAFRLTKQFMELYKGPGGFTQENLAKVNLSYDNIFEEIPIRIHNSHLIDAFLLQFQDDETAVDRACDFDRLDLATNPFLETNLEFLIEAVDKLAVEQTDFQYYQRNVQRQQTLINKRKQAGESVEDIKASLKTITEPSQKDTLLIMQQMSTYCHQVAQFAGQSTDKFTFLQAL